MPTSAVTATRRRPLAVAPNEPSCGFVARRDTPAPIDGPLRFRGDEFLAAGLDGPINPRIGQRGSDVGHEKSEHADGDECGAKSRRPRATRSTSCLADFCRSPTRAAGFIPAVFEQRSARDRKTAGINPAARNARIKQMLGVLLRHSVGIKLTGRTGWRVPVPAVPPAGPGDRCSCRPAARPKAAGRPRCDAARCALA